jgi:predicted O-methyltransferase YrrM
LAGAKPTAIFALMADLLREKVLALALSRQPWSAWFTDKEFSTDWVSNRAPVWAKFLAAETDCYSDVLEIGSFEGRSTIFWLEYLPRSAVTAIDTFQGTTRFHEDTEGRFDRNLAPYGARVRKIKSPSSLALSQLHNEGARFDLAYIDGDHFRNAVMADCLLVWPMLRPGGIMILDDYELDAHKPSAERPHDAIDTFLQWHADDLYQLHRGHQIIVRRLS